MAVAESALEIALSKSLKKTKAVSETFDCTDDLG